MILGFELGVSDIISGIVGGTIAGGAVFGALRVRSKELIETYKRLYEGKSHLLRKRRKQQTSWV